MGKPSRDKGQREERSIVHAFQEAGIGAERIPLSGAAGGKFVGDVSIPVQGQDWVFEAKVRADGFRQLYSWLAEHKGLFIRADRRERLVVLRESDFIKLARPNGGISNG